MNNHDPKAQLIRERIVALDGIIDAADSEQRIELWAYHPSRGYYSVHYSGKSPELRKLLAVARELYADTVAELDALEKGHG